MRPAGSRLRQGHPAQCASTIELDAGAIAPFLRPIPTMPQFADDNAGAAIENDFPLPVRPILSPALPKTGDNRRAATLPPAPGPQRTLERLTPAKAPGLPV